MSLSKKESGVIDAWAKEICNKKTADKIHSEVHWESMFIGFAIGKGLSVDQATNYNLYRDHAFPKEDF